MLLPQIGAIVFLLMVIVRQIGLFRKKIQTELIPVRRQLFVQSLAVLFLAAVVFLVGIATVLELVTRSTKHLNSVGVILTVAYNGAILLASYSSWISYRMASKISLIVETGKRDTLNTKP